MKLKLGIKSKEIVFRPIHCNFVDEYVTILLDILIQLYKIKIYQFFSAGF